MALRVGALLAGGLYAGTLASQARPGASDSAALQGTWRMVSGMVNGTPMPAIYAAEMKRVMESNVVTITMSGQPYFTATVALDQGKTPKTIDYHILPDFSTATAGAVQLGIYAIKGDTVLFCFGAPNAVRPQDFTNGPGRTLSSWVRVRP